MKVWGFWPKTVTPNQLHSYEIFLGNLADFSDRLTYLLMPSDKHNSRTAWARDLISSLINVASSRDVPFHESSG